MHKVGGKCNSVSLVSCAELQFFKPPGRALRLPGDLPRVRKLSLLNAASFFCACSFCQNQLFMASPCSCKVRCCPLDCASSLSSFRVSPFLSAVHCRGNASRAGLSHAASSRSASLGQAWVCSCAMADLQCHVAAPEPMLEDPEDDILEAMRGMSVAEILAHIQDSSGAVLPAAPSPLPSPPTPRGTTWPPLPPGSPPAHARVHPFPPGSAHQWLPL